MVFEHMTYRSIF